MVNGFSKAYAMTGWRLGWMVHPSRCARHLAILSECFNTGATVFTQVAGIAALDRGEHVIRDLRMRYSRGRDIVMKELSGHSRMELARPQGAFYAFVRVPGMRSSLAFAEGVLAECDVRAGSADWVTGDLDATRCPRCGSLRVRDARVDASGRGFRWRVLGVPLPFLRRRASCRHCGHRWLPA